MAQALLGVLVFGGCRERGAMKLANLGEGDEASSRSFDDQTRDQKRARTVSTQPTTNTFILF